MSRTKRPAWVYVVRCSDGTLYTGMTTNLTKRIDTHNRGKGAKYTRGRLPVVLIHQEGPMAYGDALRRERTIKMLSRKEKLMLIEGTHRE